MNNNLKYFTSDDCISDQSLKSKYRKLAHAMHPDKFPNSQKEFRQDLFQRMKSEYEGIKNKGQIKNNTQTNPIESAKNQAQKIFHALTNLGRIDIQLLIVALNEVTNWNLMMQEFSKAYGIDITALVISKIKDGRKKEMILTILLQLQTAKGTIGTIRTITDTLKNLFNTKN